MQHVQDIKLSLSRCIVDRLRQLSRTKQEKWWGEWRGKCRTLSIQNNRTIMPDWVKNVVVSNKLWQVRQWVIFQAKVTSFRACPGPIILYSLCWCVRWSGLPVTSSLEKCEYDVYDIAVRLTERWKCISPGEICWWWLSFAVWERGKRQSSWSCLAISRCGLSMWHCPL